MKKIFLLCLIIFDSHFSIKSQITVNDTLRYFTNKQLYKLPVASIHPYYTEAAMSNNAISHVGSVFKNKQALRIIGLEVKVLKKPVTVTVDTIPMRLYLCNVVNGLPIFPAIDSVNTGAGNATDLQFGRSARGTFTASAPRIVTGDFAVLAKCVSLNSGDTVKILRTSGYTSTSTAVTTQQKFGEGLGVLRQNGVFNKTTNFNHPQFGNGTDYEFCVAPLVTFTLAADQMKSITMEGACKCEVFTNTNTSTPALTNRQFNFNEFYRQLKPFDASFPNFTPDSVLAFDLGDGAPPFFLPPNTDTINLVYWGAATNSFFPGSVTGKYKRMSEATNGLSEIAVLSFTGSSIWCNDLTTNGDCTTGLAEWNALANIRVFPNPAVDKISIFHLNGKNTILLFNSSGQLVFKDRTEVNDFVIPIEGLPKGFYLLKITNDGNRSRTTKVLKM